MSLPRLGRRAGLWCWNLVAFTIVTLALLISLVRTLLPQLDGARDYLIEQAQQRYGIELELDRLGAQWQTNGPHLLLDGFRLPSQQQLPLTLEIDQIELKLNFWESLFTLEPQFDRLAINGVNLDLTLKSDQSKEQSKPSYDAAALRPLRTLLLEQIEQLNLSDIRLNLRRGEKQFEPIHLAHWQWLNSGSLHLGQGEVYLDQSRQANEKLSLSVELQAKGKGGLFGRAYLQAAELDIGAWMLRNLDDGGSDYTGVLNLEGWVTFTEQEVLQAQAQLDGSEFRWQGQQAHQYSIDQGSVIWRPTQQGWRLDSNPILVSNSGNQWPATAFHANQSQEQLFLQLDPVALQGLKPVMAMLPVLSPQQKRDLLQSQSTGTIGPIKARYQTQDDGQQQWHVDMPFEALGWQMAGQLPGVAGLTGSVQWIKDHVEFDLDTNGFALEWPSQLPQPMGLEQLTLKGRWQPQQHGSQLQIEQFTLVNTDIELDLQAGLLFEPEQAPQLQLATAIDLHHAGRIDNYLPRVMGQNLADYLGEAIQAGHFDDGKMVWHGALNQYPYTEYQGNFVAGFTMQQLRFDFLPDWPAVENAMLDARFANQRMDLQVINAELAGVELEQISIDIPELGGASELQIDGDVTATAVEVKQVLAPTFLAETVGKTLDIVQPQQALPINLDMSFYLGKKVKHLSNKVEGTVSFWNTDLFLEPLQLTLEKVRGELKFDNSTIDASNLMATMLNQPTEFKVHGENREQGYGIDIDLNSRWQISRLPDGLQSPIITFLDGGAAVTGEVGLLINDGLSYTGEVNSDLVGISIGLPAPLAKSRNDEGPLQLRIKGDAAQAQVELDIDQRFGFAGPMTFDAPQLFQSYGLAIEPRAEPVKIAERQGLLRWQTTNIQMESWLPLLEALSKPSKTSSSSDLEQSSKPWFAPLTRVELDAQQFNLYDLNLGDGQIVATPTESNWQLVIDSNRAKATVALSKQKQLTVDVDADYLQLGDPEMISSVTVDPNITSVAPEPMPPLQLAPASQISEMPNLDIEVADLRVGVKQLGPATLVAEREASHYRIKQLQLGPEEHRLQAQGLWLNDKGVSKTRLTGSLNTQKTDELLERLALEGSIVDATGNLEFELAWQGAPWQLRRDNLEGDFSFEINDGHLKQVSDKGTRLLSLFSLESLVRKLALDFSDVFGKGMPFETFEATVELNNGIASTKNGKMDSSAGVLKVAGWTNLHTREIDYRLTFSPAVTSSLPAVMYLSTGALAVGISAFAVTKLLEPVIEVVTQLSYHLTGTLDEPKLDEVDRVKQEVEIRPSPEAPQPTQAPSQQQQLESKPNQEGSDAVSPIADDQPSQSKH